MSVDFAIAVQRAVEAGLAGAAILDAHGTPLAVAGVLGADEARALAAHGIRHARDPDLLPRMLQGSLVEALFGELEARIGIAARCVFVVGVFPYEHEAIVQRYLDVLRMDIEAIVRANPGLPLIVGVAPRDRN